MQLGINMKTHSGTTPIHAYFAALKWPDAAEQQPSANGLLRRRDAKSAEAPYLPAPKRFLAPLRLRFISEFYEFWATLWPSRLFEPFTNQRRGGQVVLLATAVRRAALLSLATGLCLLAPNNAAMAWDNYTTTIDDGS